MEKNTCPVCRIDEKVYFTMGFVAMAFSLLLIYSYKTAKPCQPVNIIFPDTEMFAGSLISLKAETKEGKTYVWDFGDKNNITMNTPFASHIYRSPGIYRVHLSVNGSCEGSENIIISERPASLPAGKDHLAAGFTCPLTVRINQPVKFIDTTIGAVSREWFFEQIATVSDTSRKAIWTFTNPGLQTVYLRINGRPDWSAQKDIMVTDPGKIDPRPHYNDQVTPPSIITIYDRPADTTGQKTKTAFDVLPETVKKAPDIQAEEMELLLEDVVTGAKTAEFFSKYFCDNSAVAVEYNNEPISFAEMCSRLKQFKSVNKIKRPVVSLSKNKSTGCLLSIKVTVNKESAWKQITHKFGLGK